MAMLVSGLLMGISPSEGSAGDWSAKAKVLHQFTGLNGDGNEPRGRLIEGPDGFLYGTTLAGGRAGKGTLFRIRTNGSDFLVIRHFTGLGDEGGNPAGGVILGQDGALYGTTADWSGLLYGTIFRCSPGGEDFRTIKRIRRNNPTASLDPPLKFLEAGLVQSADGMLFGCSAEGGANGWGAIFAIATNGTDFKRLHDFTGGNADGYCPRSALIQSTNGSLYGTTSTGGRFRRGTVFRIDPNGRNYAVLAHLGNTPADAAEPFGALLELGDGYLYGTSRLGGGSLNAGTIFRLGLNGEDYRVLRTFNTVTGEQAGRPAEGLVSGEDQMLLTTLQPHPFPGSFRVILVPRDGTGMTVIQPEGFGWLVNSGASTSPPTRGRDGMLYGTTSTGGRYNCGTIYRLTLDRKSQ